MRYSVCLFGFRRVSVSGMKIAWIVSMEKEQAPLDHGFSHPNRARPAFAPFGSLRKTFENFFLCYYGRGILLIRISLYLRMGHTRLMEINSYHQRSCMHARKKRMEKGKWKKECLTLSQIQPFSPPAAFISSPWFPNFDSFPWLQPSRWSRSCGMCPLGCPHPRNAIWLVTCTSFLGNKVLLLCGRYSNLKMIP